MGSVRRRNDMVRVSLERTEASLLVSIASQLRAILSDESDAGPDAPLERILASIEEPVDPPEGAVLGRLLPPAYIDDADAAAEFRRLTDGELRETKRLAQQRILDDVAASGAVGAPRGGRVELDEEGATRWLYGLADLRLALGTRLDITEDIDDRREALAPDSPGFAELAVYDWLTWLQDALVRAVSGE